VRQCHQIFAVAMIGRATTDQGVKEVFELARHAALSNVGIICTKSDVRFPLPNPWAPARPILGTKIWMTNLCAGHNS